MVQQLCLPPQTERKVEAPRERQDLNAAIQIEHHGTLTLEEILVYLKDAKAFSIREKKCGYRNVVPGKESINLTTFERHRFRRMPFSLKISQEFFQTKRDQNFFSWLHRQQNC